MYGPNTEHAFYSFTPKFATQAGYRVGEAGRALQRIPRLDDKVTVVRFLLEIPQPHHRVQPQTQSGGSFGALAFEGLRLLAAEKLLGVFEGVFDGPAVGKAADHLGRMHRHVGGEEKVVFFFALGIAADHQQDRLLPNAIPENLSSVNQSGLDLATLANLYLLPMANIVGHFFRAEK